MLRKTQKIREKGSPRCNRGKTPPQECRLNVVRADQNPSPTPAEPAPGAVTKTHSAKKRRGESEEKNRPRYMASFISHSESRSHFVSSGIFNRSCNCFSRGCPFLFQ